MIYQGTVWGPPFWNCYYADSKLSIRMNDFTEIIYADDLNAFKAYLNSISHKENFADIDRCQAALHSWGRANKVTFDAGKESRHIISKTDPTDSTFHLLGVDFDCKLLMNDATHSCTIAASWKLRSLLRTRRFYTGGDLIHMFKTHILSFIEYRTPVFMHAAHSSLASLDRILSRFLEDIGVSNLDALISFNLAPLATRRDIAALAVIHRAILKQGPSHFHKWFVLDHNPPSRSSSRFGHPLHDRQVLDRYTPLHRDYLNRSVFGYIWIYNLLPSYVVATSKINIFQSRL